MHALLYIIDYITCYYSNTMIYIAMIYINTIFDFCELYMITYKNNYYQIIRAEKLERQAITNDGREL